MTDDKQFNIVLEACAAENLEAITDRIASVFPIRKEMAMQLASSCPIIILDELSQGEANAVYNAMNDVVEAGAAIKVVQSDTLTSKMTRIKWPERPKIKGMDLESLSDQTVEDVGEGTVTKHVCPHCGNGILVSMDQYGENLMVQPDGEVIPSMPAGSSPPPPQQPLAPAGTEEFILSNDDLIAEIEEPHIPKTEEITNILDSVFAGTEDGGTGSGLWADNSALEPAASDPLPPPPSPTPAPAPAPPPAAGGFAPAAPADPRGATVGDDKSYNVFLPKLTSEDKKTKAIPLIVEISGISEGEAQKLSNRIVIPLVKGVSKEEAEGIKDKFMAIGILPRIRQQM